MSDNFVQYMGRLTTGIFTVDSNIRMEVSRRSVAFCVECRKYLRHKKVITSHVTRADSDISKMKEEALEAFVQADINRLLHDLEEAIQRDKIGLR